MDEGEKHLLDDAEVVLKKTKELRGREVEQANHIFTLWFYWSATFLGELSIPEDRITYFLTAYMESCREVQSSIVLALHGSYKNAIQILRSWLELIITGIYYDHHRNEGEGWLEKGHYTRFKAFKNRLERDKMLSAQTLKDVGKAWTKLSTYIHSLGHVLEGTFAETGYGTVFPEYNQRYFDEWFSFLMEVYNLCCVLLVEHIPEVLGSEEIDLFFKPKALERLRDRVTNK